MSGGSMDYISYKIEEAADRMKTEIQYIEDDVKENGLRNFEPLPIYAEKYDIPEFKSAEALYKAVMEKLREGERYMRLAAIYSHRAEWLFSSDDGYDSFFVRLVGDLKKGVSE